MVQVNRVINPAKEKELELMAAKLAKAEATLEYVAMMADVEIDEDEEGVDDVRED